MNMPCVTSALLMRSVTGSPFVRCTSLGLKANRFAEIATTRGSWARAAVAVAAARADRSLSPG
jgi:hypothetical protein